MLINFNTARLDKLLYDFYYLTGLSVGIFDSEYNKICFQPKETATFCRMINSTPEGKRRCDKSDHILCGECARIGTTVTHCCHAGLLDTAVPIKYKDTILGFMMFGQIAENSGNDTESTLLRISRELKLDLSELTAAYNKLEAFDTEKTEAAINIIKTATRYLWLSEYIELGYDNLASQLNDYVSAHISENITVQDLCETLGISKNKLYDISHRWFGKSIGEYIAEQRIEQAKQLLLSSELNIAQVGSAVGIRDYNYFTKFFKAKVGLAPLKYRKSEKEI